VALRFILQVDIFNYLFTKQENPSEDNNWILPWKRFKWNLWNDQTNWGELTNVFFGE